MDKELKTRWVAALRSGSYKQAHGTLRDCDGFCCLGVLLDVADKGEWIDGDAGLYEIDGCQLEGDLAGCRDTFELTKEQEKVLVAMNDEDEKIKDSSQPFAVIADYIEVNL